MPNVPPAARISWKGPPPIDISSTIPSNPDSRLLFLLKLNTADADVIGKTFESSLSSEMQFGSLTKAELGGVSLVVLTVAQGLELAQSIAVVAVQPAGRAGAVTLSKFSAQGTATLQVAHWNPSVILIVSTLQPTADTLLSDPMRNRITTFCPAAAAGKLMLVVVNPFEFPVNAWRPAIGLAKLTLIVPL